MIELIENHEALGTIWHIEIYDIPYTVQYEVNIEENISRNNIEFVS